MVEQLASVWWGNYRGYGGAICQCMVGQLASMYGGAISQRIVGQLASIWWGNQSAYGGVISQRMVGQLASVLWSNQPAYGGAISQRMLGQSDSSLPKVQLTWLYNTLNKGEAKNMHIQPCQMNSLDLQQHLSFLLSTHRVHFDSL